MLWILGGKDTIAPHEETLERLIKIKDSGASDMDIMVFPNANHGIVETLDTPEGRILAGGHSEGYFQLLVDFILKKKIEGKYGDGIRY